MTDVEKEVVKPSFPVRNLQKLIRYVHDETNLDWWSTIAACTLGFRLCLTPLVYIQLQNARRMVSGAAPSQMALLTNLLLKEVRNPQTNVFNNRRAFQLYSSGIQKVWRNHSVSLWKLFLVPIVQIPVFLTYVFSIRNLINSNSAVEWGMNKGGFAWFEDLTIPDPTFVLPATALGLTFISIQIGWGFLPVVRKFLQGMLVLSSPVVFLKLPAGVFMYWIPSAMFGLTQTSLIRLLSRTPPPVTTTATMTAAAKKMANPSQIKQQINQTMTKKKN